MAIGSNLPDSLSDLFGDYRAEWRGELFRSHFIRPPYQRDLEALRPCFLFGGRGTGKTTVLRSMRFDTQVQDDAGAGRAYLGIYVRVNKNRVRAFEGAALTLDTWARAFAHYFNLLVASELSKLMQWLESSEGWAPFSLDELTVMYGAFGLASGLDRTANVSSFQHMLLQSIQGLEIYVNNPLSVAPPIFSMAEAPLRAIAEVISHRLEFRGRCVYCCIDEYENLTDYQQSVVNTYIKHAEPPLSYKIGTRYNGIKTNNTWGDNLDQIRYPDDYNEIHIDKHASQDAFLVNVIERRLDLARQAKIPVPQRASDFLPGYSQREEAHELGSAMKTTQVLKAVAKEKADVRNWVASLGNDAYFLAYCAEMDGQSIGDAAKRWFKSRPALRTRMNNYGYASLFWLSRGHKGATHRKFYCGSDTFLALAAGNVRYMLELIDTSVGLLSASSSRRKVGKVAEISVSQKDQTESAKLVGKRRLDQLESQSERGPELRRLVLILGKVFFEFARSAMGHSPERTTFVLSGASSAKKEVSDLLRNGVAHLAFEAAPRTKATSDTEIRDEEYRLHPIFAPFFEFSHRRKRRVTFPAEVLQGLTRKRPSAVIRALLREEEQAPVEDLPLQLALFEKFFYQESEGAGES